MARCVRASRGWALAGVALQEGNHVGVLGSAVVPLITARLLGFFEEAACCSRVNAVPRRSTNRSRSLRFCRFRGVAQESVHPLSRSSLRRRALLAGALLGLVAACGPVPVDPDGGSSTPDDGGPRADAGLTTDGGGTDAGTLDAGLIIDAGTSDAGPVIDAGAEDAGLITDAGSDAGLIIDAGAEDAGLIIDAGAEDAGLIIDGGPDAGPIIDAGSDAGLIIDAGMSDGGSSLDAGPGFVLPDGGSVCGRCAAYGSVTNMGMIGLVELSGLAASRMNPGVLYAHDDSGGPASLTIMRTNGATIGTLALMNATNLDWEDLALGPCPTGTCLYVGEIGDNANANLTYAVYRVPEPVIAPGTMPGMLIANAERFELAYPNGLKTDAETLLVHPVTGDVYVVSKRQFGSKSSAYKAAAPLAPVSPNVMTLVASMAVPDGLDLPITAGDIDPCGTTLLLRSYSTLYQFVLPANAASFDAIFTAPFSRVPVASFPAQEAQGEAVCWNPGGGYFTASEGQLQQLHFVGCQ